ncbi:MAG: SH3 domain-containing protein, partial [Clostridia bacterium]|nr:SH3 domain-containing protein [Clostridia bacterium]
MKNQSLSVKILSVALALAFIIALFPAAVAESYEAEVNVSRMMVRSGPTTAYEVIGYLQKGTRVTVLATSGGIAKISYKGKTGFSLLSQLSPVSASTPTPTPTPDPTPTATPTSGNGSGSLSGLGTITSSTANVYASASADSTVLMVAKQGQTFTVLATNGTWARLQNGSAIGYVKMSQLNIRVGVTATPASGSVTPTPVPGPTPTGLAYIKQDNTKIYSSYSTTSNVIAILNQGANFTILAMNDSWVKLENGRNVGFVERKNV